MKGISVLLPLTLLLMSCASPQWVKPGSTPAELDADTVSCNNEIVTSSIGARAIRGMGAPTVGGRTAITSGARADAARALEQCLQGKGWTRETRE